MTLASVTELWTPVAILTVIFSGIAWAVVIHRLRPSAVPVAPFMASALMVMWLVPVIAQRMTDLHAPPGVADRTLGSLVLFLIAFVPATWATLALLARRRRP